jgi:hypothetical protein
MPLKKVRKNASPEKKREIIGNNIGVLHNNNRSLPAAEKHSHKEIVAAALTAAGIKKPAPAKKSPVKVSPVKKKK